MKKSLVVKKRELEYHIYEVMSMIKGVNTGHSSSAGNLIEQDGVYYKINLEEVTNSSDKHVLSLMKFMEESVNE